jgi:hypothetical protein
MKTFINLNLLSALLLFILSSCHYSESDRKAAEEKLIAAGVFKADSIIKKENSFNELIKGQWLLDKVYFINSKQVMKSQREYKKFPDHVTKVEYNGISKHKEDIYEYSLKNIANGIQTADYNYNISDDLLMEDLLDAQKSYTGTGFYYKIQRISKDSLVLKYIGNSTKIGADMIETTDPYLEYYVRVY